MNILEIENLSKHYKGFSLKNIQLIIPAGYIFGFVGQNGAGKTSTINMINHICKYQQGTIKVNGITYDEDPVKYKESIAYVGDESYFTKGLKIKTVKKTLKDFYKTFDEDKFDSLIQRYGLPTNKKIDDFSRGMKVKLMFACVFSRDSKLMILDEATNGLDPVVRDELLSDLQAYIEDGQRSILFSTHVLSDLEEIADYIAFIDNGEILLDKSKDEMLEDYLVVKGDVSELTREQKQYIIGLEEKTYGFEGIIKSEDVEKLGGKFTYDKPEIAQIMLHSIKDRRNR
jgi:ABC-2 type transport system ATP-binding protein